MDPARFSDRSPGRLVPAFDGSAAFVPNALPRAFDLEPSTWRRTLDAERALASLGGVLSGLHKGELHPALLVGALARREALVSSRIEGTISTARQLVLFEAGAESEIGSASDVASTREVANYLRALDYGVAELARLPIGARFIRELHARLLDGVRGSDETPGEFRRVQNYIGAPGQSIRDARFTPPPPSHVDACIADFERALHEPESDSAPPILVRVAMLHYQFECIHPFRDGNGRVGRLLIPLMLRTHRPDSPLVLVSEQLEHRRAEYYDLLLDVSVRGSSSQWIEFFLGAIERSAIDAQRRAIELLELRDEWREKLSGARSSSLLLALVDELFRRPTMTRQQASELLAISAPAASSNVMRLVEAGILVEATGRQRGQVFVAPRLLELSSGD